MLLEIQTGKGKKGRSFRAELLSWIDAPSFFEGGDTDTPNNRPVWMTVASSEQETRAFVTNLRKGKIAEKVKPGYSRNTDGRFQLLKTAGYHIHQQRLGDGIVTTFYLPDLFVVNPGMVDPDVIRFIMLPGQQWLDNQTIDPADAEALLFLAYLDRRTRFPFPPDVRFARQVLDRCVELGYASRGQSSYSYNRHMFRYVEHDFDALGLQGGIAFLCSHKILGEILADEIKKWGSHR